MDKRDRVQGFLEDIGAQTHWLAQLQDDQSAVAEKERRLLQALENQEKTIDALLA